MTQGSSSIYQDRRAALWDVHQQVLIVCGNDVVQLVADLPNVFRQEASFYWLTGIDEPGWTLVIESRDTSYLIPKVHSDIHNTFNGFFDEEKIKGISGAEIVSKQSRLDVFKRLRKYHDTVSFINTVYQDLDMQPNNAPIILLDELKGVFPFVQENNNSILRLRALKSDKEIEFINHSVEITIVSFNNIKSSLNSLESESDISRQMTIDFLLQNSHHAYEPIVAGGKNALTLHYNRNSDTLPRNGLVLIDVGARVDGYCADITRTYAIGTPSPREIAVHAAVQKAHYAIIDLIKPGLSFSEYQAKSDEIMKRALRSLELLKKPEDYRKYFPHAISHGLGIDVHESLGGYKEFMPGMVLTVEPGIYIPEEGIGVRIEDDILVTETGYENLSAALSTDL